MLWRKDHQETECDMGHSGSRSRRRLTRLASLPVAALLLLSIGAASSQAAVLPTNTTVAISGVGADGSLTFTATVSAVNPLSSMGGPVTFTDTTSSTTLGSAPLGPRLCNPPAKLCTSSITVPSGTVSSGDVVTASYPGNFLFKPSSGSTQLGEVTSCSPSSSCSAGGMAADDSSSLDVEQFNSTGSTQQIVVSFTTTPLSCTTPNTGDTGVWSVTDLVDAKSIEYDAYGAAADAAQAAHPIPTDAGLAARTAAAYVCFDGPTTFTTWSGTPATRQADGTFAGRLPPCPISDSLAAGPVTGGPPCVSDAQFTTDTDFGDGYFTTVDAPAGEPHMSH
jgi:hypothetical protein